ncbi:MAG TPA: hypothetical protein PK970_06145 [Hyphomicrobiaceae bacterium]|nr:hypothetical protein [Hyphomicrobiaceae bacterium]
MTSHANAPVMPRQPGLPAALGGFLSSRWLWCALAAAFCMMRTFGDPASSLANSLGDTDDATRLLFVREFLAGAPWFEAVSTRLGGPTPLVSHWSRLIDLPIAALVTVFGWFVSSASAEVLARALWPTLLLMVFFRLLLREIELRAGAQAALLLLALGATCMSGLFQFAPGRIDHHNAMIVGAVTGLLMLTRAAASPTVGTPAGILLGLALAVGYEPLALVLLALVAAGLAALVMPELRDGLSRAAAAMALTLAVVFVATVPPARYLDVKCDALSLNLIVFAAGATAGLEWLRRAGAGSPVWQSLAILAVPTAAGAALYGLLEPVCLAGPFAQVDPAVKPIWLDKVQETRSFAAMFPDNPLPITVVSIVFVASLLCAAAIFRRERTTANGLLFGLLLVSLPLGMWQTKLTPYSVWIATFATALWISSLRGSASVTPLTARLGATVGLNQSTLALVVAPLLSIGGASADQLNATNLRNTEDCRSTPVVSAMSALPRGFVVAPADLGPYVAVLTRHDALAAPYHRIDKAIVTAHAILEGEPSAAEQRLRALGTTYVAVCASDIGDPKRKPGGELAGTFQTRLLAGQGGAFLEEIDLGKASKDLRVWKMLPAAR